MPCVSYFSDSEMDVYRKDLVTDFELFDLMVEAGMDIKDYVIRWQEFNVQISLFRKKKIKLYCLYCHVLGAEWQIFNWPRVKSEDSTINHWVSRQIILTYLMGVRNGLASKNS